MARLIDTHPALAQWLAALLTVVLMTILNWLSEPGPITKHIPAILGAGVGVFIAMGYLRRRSMRKTQQRLDRSEE